MRAYLFLPKNGQSHVLVLLFRLPAFVHLPLHSCALHLSHLSAFAPFCMSQAVFHEQGDMHELCSTPFSLVNLCSIPHVSSCFPWAGWHAGTVFHTFLTCHAGWHVWTLQTTPACWQQDYRTPTSVCGVLHPTSCVGWNPPWNWKSLTRKQVEHCVSYDLGMICVSECMWSEWWGRGGGGFIEWGCWFFLNVCVYMLVLVKFISNVSVLISHEDWRDTDN